MGQNNPSHSLGESLHQVVRACLANIVYLPAEERVIHCLLDGIRRAGWFQIKHYFQIDAANLRVLALNLFDTNLQFTLQSPYDNAVHILAGYQERWFLLAKK